MKVGIGLPATIPGVDGATILEWARQADAGPFSSVAVIDRVVYPNYEPMVTLAAAAAVTRRVRLVTSIVIGPLRGAALLAKEAASIDALSRGRLTLGLAVGMRQDDFDAAGVLFKGRGQRFEQQLALMKRIWEQRPFAEGAGKVGPAPGRAGGPEVLIGGFSEAAVQRVGKFADGFLAAGDPETARKFYSVAEASWKEQRRPGKPRFLGLGYFGLGAALGARPSDYIHHYYAFAPPMADMIASTILKTPEAVRGALKAFESVGMDELVLFPTVPDVGQVKELARAIG